MSTTDLKELFRFRGFLPHQAEFAKQFIETETKRNVLQGPPGSGKGFTLAGICAHATSTGDAKRILVLCPAPLVAQWADQIESGSPGTSVLQVDRRRLREMEAAGAEGGSIWPADVIAVASIDFAKRASLSMTQGDWDLVVVDEAHQITRRTQRFALIDAIGNECPSARFVFLQITSPFAEAGRESGVAFEPDSVTHWSRSELRDWDGEALFAPIQFTWIEHTRNADEVAVMVRLQELLASIVTKQSSSQLIGRTLVQAASSSPFALEQRLARLIHRRNELVHGARSESQQLLFDDLVHLGDEQLELDFEVHERDDDFGAIVSLGEMARELIEMLDEVGPDSKLVALMELLGRILGAADKKQNVVIVTQFVDTAKYLHSGLSESYPDVASLTGESSSEQRLRRISEFSVGPGILISTAVTTGTMPHADHVVFYDIPWNPVSLEMRIGQFVRFGRRQPVKLYAFSDRSSPLAAERLHQKVVEIRQTLGDSLEGNESVRTLVDEAAEMDWLSPVRRK